MKNTISSEKLYISIFLLLCCISTFSWFSSPYLLGMKFLLYFALLFVLPGYLILRILHLNNLTLVEVVLYILTFSTVFVLVSGLFLNTILPIMGFSEPLTYSYIVFFFSALLLILNILNFNSEDLHAMDLSTYNPISYILSGLSILGLLFTIFGTTLLNNEKSNFFSLLSILLVPVILVLVAFFNKTINSKVFPFVIFFVAVNLMLLYSLRSWHVNGFDITQELNIFGFTDERNKWVLEVFKDPYNACLSITIFPKILYELFNIPIEYIFKIVFPIIAAFIPVVIYLIFTKFTDNLKAFLGAVFFTIQIQFVFQMPALTRQCLALLLFTLMIEVLLNGRITKFKNTIVAVLGTGMILSHYSTTYLAILLLVFMYMGTKAYIWFFKSKTIRNNLKFTTLTYLVLFTFLWNAILTDTADNVFTTVSRTFFSINKIFSSELRSEKVIKSISFSEIDKEKILTGYYTDVDTRYKTSVNEVYSNLNLNGYPIILTDPEILQRYEPLVAPANLLFHIVVPLIFRVTLLIGLWHLFTIFRKSSSAMEFGLLSFASVSLLFSIIVLPYLSMNYNVERLYQQGLIFLSLPIIWGFYTGLKFLDKKAITVIATLLISTYYLVNIGLIDRVFLGVPSVLLDNTGEHYDRYYIYDTEADSMVWMDENVQKGDRVYADRYALLRIKALSQNIPYPNVIQEVLPITIFKNSYVYSSRTNTVKEKTFANFNETIINYNYPTDFLNETKGVVYTNGDTKVYR